VYEECSIAHCCAVYVVDGGCRVSGGHSAVEDALHEPLQGSIAMAKIMMMSLHVD